MPPVCHFLGKVYLNILHGEEKESRKISDFSDVNRILMF